jgi:hypothetical protein
VRYIKEFGLENYVAAIVSNQGKGIKYGLNGAYCDKTETEVMSLLKTMVSVVTSFPSGSHGLSWNLFLLTLCV